MLMPKLSDYSFILTLKIVGISIFSGLVSWYFILNPSFPSIVAGAVGIAALYATVHVTISTVVKYLKVEENVTLGE
jgi:membrane protein YdbS with pleckstrin-like domain